MSKQTPPSTGFRLKKPLYHAKLIHMEYFDKIIYIIHNRSVPGHLVASIARMISSLKPETKISHCMPEKIENFHSPECVCVEIEVIECAQITLSDKRLEL